jgi:flagellin-specific chaperone FliS
MKLSQTQKSYRMSAIQGASSIGLIIVLFDTLADDLRQAAAALRKNDIEERCRQLNHGSLVLGQLENWVDRVHGGESALCANTNDAGIGRPIGRGFGGSYRHNHECEDCLAAD